MPSISYTNVGAGSARHFLRDLIRARQLLLDLVWKDLRARYRYALMGFLWAVLEPVAMMLILAFVFSFVLRGKVELGVTQAQAPFALFLLSGLLFWQFFSSALTSATNSLVDNQHLIKKVYFTREVVPLAAIGYPLVNLLIGFAFFIVLHLLMGGAVSAAWLMLPVLLGIEAALLAGLGLLLSAGHVHFRDVGYVTGVAVMFGFYASPIFYSLELVRENLPAWAYYLYRVNPMSGVIPAVRQVLFEHRLPDVALVAWPAIAAVLSLVAGIKVFRRLSPTLSDHL